MKAIDIDFDPTIWVDVPFEFPAGPLATREDWVKAVARAHSEGRADAEEASVALERSASVIPTDRRQGLLQRLWNVRDPFGVPLLTDAYLMPEELAGEATLQELVGAYDADALRPPIVDLLESEAVGPFARVVVSSRDDDDRLLVSVRTAAKVSGWVLILSAVGHEPDRAALIADDIADLMGRVVVSDDDASPAAG